MFKASETWVPAIYITNSGEVIDFSENYQVSNNQKIKYLNYEHHRGHEMVRDLSSVNAKRRYIKLTLYSEGVQYTVNFHRLVLSSFLSSSPTYEAINHKDCNTHNNNLNNLEWCTHQYNNTYHNRHLKAGEKQKGLTKPQNCKPVFQFSLDGSFLKEWSSAAEIKKQLGYNTPSIINCCNQKPHYKTAYGYIWRH